MRVGLDVGKEKIFLELNGLSGVDTTCSMSSRTARAVAGQLIATADALDAAMEEGNLGVKDDDGA